jgi:RecA-family ATPase
MSIAQDMKDAEAQFNSGKRIPSVPGRSIMKDLHNPPEPKDFLIKNLIIRGQLSIMVGNGGIGKTRFLMQLSADILMGKDRFLNELKLYVKHKKVLFISSEDVYDDFKLGIRQIFAKMFPNLTFEQVQGLFPYGDLVHVDSSVYTDYDKFMEDLDIHMEDGYDLVIIDPLGDVASLKGDINDNSSSRLLLNTIQTSVAKYQSACIIMHHTSKSQTSQVEKGRDPKLAPIMISSETVMGASSIIHKVRLAMAFTQDKYSKVRQELVDEDGDKIIVNDYQVHLYVLKANSIPSMYTENSIVLNYDGKTRTFSYACMAEIEKFKTEEAGMYTDSLRRQLPSFSKPIYESNTEPQKTESEKNLDKLLSHISKDDFAKGIQGGDLKSLVMLHLSVGENKARNIISDLKDEGLLVMVGQKYYLQGQSISQLSSQDSINMFEQKEPEF